MTNYELMMILSPDLSEEERNQSVEELKKHFSDHKVNIVSEEVWWEKKLAYKINNKTQGYYILYTLEMDGKNIKSLSKEINLDKNIWRYMFSKIED